VRRVFFFFFFGLGFGDLVGAVIWRFVLFFGCFGVFGALFSAWVLVFLFFFFLGGFGLYSCFLWVGGFFVLFSCFFFFFFFFFFFCFRECGRWLVVFVRWCFVGCWVLLVGGVVCCGFVGLRLGLRFLGLGHFGECRVGSWCGGVFWHLLVFFWRLFGFWARAVVCCFLVGCRFGLGFLMFDGLLWCVWSGVGVGGGAGVLVGGLFSRLGG